MIKKIETLDSEFCQHHYTIMELLDDKALEEKQVALDNSDERVINIIERLQQLVFEPEEATLGSQSASVDASMPL